VAWEPSDDLTLIMRVLMSMDTKLDELGEHVVAIRRLIKMMKKKRKKIELSPEWRARSEETQRLLAERIAFHERRREQLRRQQGEAQA
jgi:hypothetical protein